MKTNITFLFLLLITSFIAKSQTIDTNQVDGAIYLNVDDTTTSTLSLSATNFPGMNAIFTLYDVTNVNQPFKNLTTTLTNTYRISFSNPSDISNLIASLTALTYVNYAEPIPLFYTSYVPNDYNSNQWYLNKIAAQDAWNISTGNASVKIAIVDNAIEILHEDLASSIAINTGEIPNNGIDDDLNGYIDDYQGFDVSENDSDPRPPLTATSTTPWVHGTHCAGIASASTDNGVGISGIGFNCSIIPIKCSANSSEGNTLNAAYEGIAYAVAAGADIISMSFGGPNNALNVTGNNVLTAANARGITLIAAAGNSNTSDQFMPASNQYVISVGATDQNDNRAYFSNFGSTIDVMAPGLGIYSSVSNAGGLTSYESLSGTSMACPLTAGVCGLLKSQNINRTPEEIEQLLKDGCISIDALNPGFEGQLGAGRINAFNSLSINSNVSIKEKTDFSMMKIISDNPFINSISMILSENTSLEIFSLDGQLIETKKVSSGKTEIGSNYNSGTYFVKINNSKKSDVVRIVKL